MLVNKNVLDRYIIYRIINNKFINEDYKTNNFITSYILYFIKY